MNRSVTQLSQLPYAPFTYQPTMPVPAISKLPLQWLHRGSFLAAALLTATAFSQTTGSVSGVVTDRATSGFLVGAEVHVVGTDLATATSRDGSFSISGVPAGSQTIEVSYVGRKTKSMPVNVRAGSSTTANVDLGETDVIVLE